MCKLTKFIKFSYTIRNTQIKSAKEQKANMFIFSNRFFSIWVTISLLSSTSYLFLIYQDIIDKNIKMPYLLQKEKRKWIYKSLCILFFCQKKYYSQPHLVYDKFWRTVKTFQKGIVSSNFNILTSFYLYLGSEVTIY